MSESYSKDQAGIQPTTGKLYCWSCMKPIGANQVGDRYILAACCANESYPHLESSYPQAVQMEMP